MSIVKNSLSFLTAFLLTVQVYSQATRSPFSTFGIGESFGNALANNQGMGGIGVSQPQYFFVNHMNPALLVYNTFTVFQAGMLVEQRRIKADTVTESSTAGNLNYLVTAFPIAWRKKNCAGTACLRWASSVSLAPYTTVKYKLAYTDDIIGSTEEVEVIEEGSGGISQLSWSNGVRLTDNFSIGLKASYLFGSVSNFYKNKLIGSTQPANYYTALEERSYVKDFIFAGGFSYNIDSLFRSKRYRIGIGGVYELGSDLKTRHKYLLYRTSAIGGAIDADTVIASIGQIRMPSGFTAGFNVSRGAQSSVGAQFSYRDWSTFRSVNSDDEGLKESWTFAFGGETTPDLYSERYLKRVTYRLGASIEEYPFLANNKNVRDRGINFGFSLPAGRSSLDFGFRYGKRGNRKENLIEESYFRVFFGVTFNDQWFIKRKFE
jgi:hypothetical protein